MKGSWHKGACLYPHWKTSLALPKHHGLIINPSWLAFILTASPEARAPLQSEPRPARCSVDDWTENLRAPPPGHFPAFAVHFREVVATYAAYGSSKLKSLSLSATRACRLHHVGSCDRVCAVQHHVPPKLLTFHTSAELS